MIQQETSVIAMVPILKKEIRVTQSLTTPHYEQMQWFLVPRETRQQKKGRDAQVTGTSI